MGVAGRMQGCLRDVLQSSFRASRRWPARRWTPSLIHTCFCVMLKLTPPPPVGQSSPRADLCWRTHSRTCSTNNRCRPRHCCAWTQLPSLAGHREFFFFFGGGGGWCQLDVVRIDEAAAVSRHVFNTRRVGNNLHTSCVLCSNKT